MIKKSGASWWILSRMMMLGTVVALASCAESNVGKENSGDYVSTPTVDYVERLDVYSAPHRDSFLNQLAMNYRSYAIYNARTSGYPDIGELFANKAVAAFSGEVPFPESLDNWEIDNDNAAYELAAAYNDMIELLKNDASDTNPELAAELQAKYDCWLTAASSGQDGTARECKSRFEKTLTALRDCRGGKIVNSRSVVETTTVNRGEVPVVAPVVTKSMPTYYPETTGMVAMRGANRAREGVIIVNNVNVPEHLINPVPVEPLVFNQNVYGGSKTVTDNRSSTNIENSGNTLSATCPCAAGNNGAGTTNVTVNVPVDVANNGAIKDGDRIVDKGCDCAAEEVYVADDYVTRAEFVEMMMAMRQELAAINARLDKLQANQKPDYDEKTIIKVQQIPLEPKQHVMEEVFEVRFDFDKATIKPEYEDLIRQLVDATQSNKNIKVSVVGHTDTAGSKSYNYALGGRRAEAVQKMLIKYGIPSSQIVAVSAGEEDLKVPTPDGVPNAENRRVRVVKEVTYTEPGGTRMVPVADVSVQEFVDDCDGFECNM